MEMFTIRRRTRGFGVTMREKMCTCDWTKVTGLLEEMSNQYKDWSRNEFSCWTLEFSISTSEVDHEVETGWLPDDND